MNIENISDCDEHDDNDDAKTDAASLDQTKYLKSLNIQ